MKLDAGLTAVVTGAASGIGLALTQALAKRGLNVVMADRDAYRLPEALATLPPGRRYATVVTDVSDPASVEALAAEVADRFGAVHLLANNAGILRMGAAWETHLDAWNSAFGVNVFGIIHAYRAFVPAMLAHGQPAHVINTASVGGLITGEQISPYVVSKQAAVALSESLAVDLVGTNLGVTVLCPGGVDTDIAAAEIRRRQAGGAPPHGLAQEVLARIARRTDVDSPATIAAVALEAVERGELYAMRFPAGSREAIRSRFKAIERAMHLDEERTDVRHC